MQGTRYLVSNGTSYTPYYAAATPYAPAAAAAAAGSATAGGAPVYPAAALAAPPPTAIQYSMPVTTVDNGCGQQMLLVTGNGPAPTGPPPDRPADVRRQLVCKSAVILAAALPCGTVV